MQELDSDLKKECGGQLNEVSTSLAHFLEESFLYPEAQLSHAVSSPPEHVKQAEWQG